MSSFLILFTLLAASCIVISLWTIVVKPLFYLVAGIVLTIVAQFVRFGHFAHKHWSYARQRREHKRMAKKPKKSREEMDDFDLLYEACGRDSLRLAIALQKQYERQGL